MLYVNDYDIENLIRRSQYQVGYPQSPETAMRNKAARVVSALMEETNRVSDGWAYWSPPCKSAEKMILIAQGKTEATEANWKKAAAQIKSFFTRRGNKAGMVLPELLKT